MTPLETVARAIAKIDHRGRVADDAYWTTPCTGADNYREMAKAALEALREPSEGMVEAGEAISVRDFVPAGQFTTLTWQAMITAALGEQP